MCKKLTSMYVKNEYTIFQPINVSTFTGRKREWRYFRPSPSPSRVKSAYRNFLLGVASLSSITGQRLLLHNPVVAKKKGRGEAWRRRDVIRHIQGPPPPPPTNNCPPACLRYWRTPTLAVYKNRWSVLHVRLCPPRVI